MFLCFFLHSFFPSYGKALARMKQLIRSEVSSHQPIIHSLSRVGDGLGMGIQEGLVFCKCYLDAPLAPVVNVR